MIRKIGWAIFLYALLSFIVSFILMMGFLYTHFTKIQISQLKNETDLIVTGVEQKGQSYLDNVVLTNTRITWIGVDGTVIYDSTKNNTSLDNHNNRTEVKQARQLGRGQSIRYSTTLTERLIYVARILKDNSVIRLSISQQTIFLFLIQMLPYIGIIFVLIVFLSIIIARKTSKKIISPLNKLDLENPLKNKVYNELNPLLVRLDRNQKDLKIQKKILKQKNEEFETIISKIKEGMIILDKEGKIVTYNPAAKSLFDLKEVYIGKKLVMIKRHPNLNELVTKTLQGKKIETILEFENKHYKFLGRPILEDKKTSGMVILSFDITEKIQLESFRREFTSNVTHELRTPLQIMIGYSEILKENKVSEQEVHLFSNKIYKEAKRMIKLVEDILSLSQLEELNEISMEKVNLFQLAKTVLDNLKEKAKDRKVELFVEGKNIIYEGNLLLLHSIFYNLCSNAIKYNIKNGKVIVRLKKYEKEVIFEIEDTGIGISKDDCKRIFERFYRVNKSRTKKISGTGLGLSIVKHAVQLHGGNINVNSELEKGTLISITFPILNI
ncbi:MAG: PAS domain-containing protein [Leptotrichiaceae bacterium]|nr:PAS domain-containing protein [Leptotrichiaceae bacterium]